MIRRISQGVVGYDELALLLPKNFLRISRLPSEKNKNIGLNK